MSSLVDIFGIETDYAIEQEMEERKKKAWAKRRKIIDGDILVYRNNYSMLDKMSYKPTKATKKQFIIDYLMREIPLVRKGADSRGKYYFAYDKEYTNKPVDKEMCVKMADYILWLYRNEEGVRFKRVDNHDRDNSYHYEDKNGVNVNKAKWDNGNLYQEYLEKMFREEYPIEKHKNYYSSDGKSVWTQYASDELKDRARALSKEDSRYVKLVDVD